MARFHNTLVYPDFEDLLKLSRVVSGLLAFLCLRDKSAPNLMDRSLTRPTNPVDIHFLHLAKLAPEYRRSRVVVFDSKGKAFPLSLEIIPEKYESGGLEMTPYPRPNVVNPFWTDDGYFSFDIVPEGADFQVIMAIISSELAGHLSTAGVRQFSFHVAPKSAFPPETRGALFQYQVIRIIPVD